LGGVVMAIEEHIVDRGSHFGGSAKDPRVKAIGEHLAATAHHPVERLRHPDREPLHAARERNTVGSFRDQVQVIALH
jgi:hypothetical protein